MRDMKVTSLLTRVMEFLSKGIAWFLFVLICCRVESLFSKIVDSHRISSRYWKYGFFLIYNIITDGWLRLPDDFRVFGIQVLAHRFLYYSQRVFVYILSWCKSRLSGLFCWYWLVQITELHFISMQNVEAIKIYVFFEMYIGAQPPNNGTMWLQNHVRQSIYIWSLFILMCHLVYAGFFFYSGIYYIHVSLKLLFFICLFFL